MAELKHALTTFEMTGWIQMKEKKDELNKKLAAFNEVVNHVKSQIGRVIALHGRKDRMRNGEQEKNDRELARVAENAVVNGQRRAAVAQAKAKAAAQPSSKECKILNHIPSSVPELAREAVGCNFDTPEKASTPIVLTGKLESAEMTDLLAKLKDKFKNHTYYATTKRGAEMIMGKLGKKCLHALCLCHRQRFASI